jgi:hypothetical protein
MLSKQARTLTALPRTGTITSMRVTSYRLR